jgi:hypothetical protein
VQHLEDSYMAQGKKGTGRKETPAQKRKVGKVMGEAKRGALKSGPGGKGGTVKNRKQAVAIALSEAGLSRNKKKSSTGTAKRKPGRPKKSA